MSGFKWARTAVLLAEGDPHAPYYREALEHAGLRHEIVGLSDLNELSRCDVLVLAGYGSLAAGHEAAISAWVRQGGSLVCSGHTWGLASILGLTDERHCSNGAMQGTQGDRMWPEAAPAVRFFGGRVGSAAGVSPIATLEDGAIAVGRRKVGRGATFFVGPHVGQSIATMCLGRSVECDGIGPADGSARLDDGILRAEDGLSLPFEDRTSIEGSPPFFGIAYADVLREILIRAIVEAAQSAGTQPVLTWHWPRNLDATALLTIECESYETGPVQKMHRLLSMYGGRAAWLVAPPGYPLDVYRALRSWEHEIGMAFSSDQTPWHEDKIKIQHVALSRSASVPSLLAVRPSAGAWRGYASFYELAERAGSRLSVSKGGRQAGTAGFLFGTCHPFFPTRRDGAAHLISEQPYTVFMPGQVTPEAVSIAILEHTLARAGCLHVALTPEALSNSDGFSALKRLLSECRQHRAEFLLPEEIYKFERARRSVRIIARTIGEEGQIHVASDSRMEGLTVMFGGPAVHASVNGLATRCRPVERYGATFQTIVMDVESKLTGEIHLKPDRLTLQAA